MVLATDGGLTRRDMNGNPNVDIVMCPGAGHACHADYRPSYKPKAAQDGWKRCVAWFRKHPA